jgi:hypothetical protein
VTFMWSMPQTSYSHFRSESFPQRQTHNNSVDRVLSARLFPMQSTKNDQARLVLLPPGHAPQWLYVKAPGC